MSNKGVTPVARSPLMSLPAMSSKEVDAVAGVKVSIQWAQPLTHFGTIPISYMPPKAHRIGREFMSESEDVETMPSAITVRRAAQTTLESYQPSPTPSTLSPDSNPKPKHPNPPPKRKSSSVNGKSLWNSKKAKSHPGQVSTTAWHFESKNMVEGEEDVIMLGSSSDSEPDVQAKLVLDSYDNSATATGLQNETSALSIDREETLTLLGTYTPTVLNTILGVTLSASKVAHHMFIPHSTPIPILQFASLDMHADSNIYSLPPSPHIRNIHGGAAVAVQSLDTGVEGLGRVCLLLVQPESWSIALSTAETPPSSADPIPLLVYVVKGSKKSGKSTFAQTLLNRLLARFQGVAYLECDVGQSEFTPGGWLP
ncbi:hypothetical protein F4604DRAFT_2042995 [Suillus subluteus]|nr:hypothetical protein F4604DRAFT_2042995 [Suillus subluteus]